MPLEFTLILDVQNKRLTLMDNDVFVKDYYFIKAVLPEHKGVYKTEISHVEAKTSEGKVTKLPNVNYRSAHKLLVTKNPMIEIVDTQYHVDELFHGVILDSESIEELAMLLRKGNVVEIRY